MTVLKNTGERCLINEEKINNVHLEHLHRYQVAASVCQGKKVLDIASGSGYGSYMLAEKAKSVIGVDISDEAVNFAGERYKSPNLKYVVGNAVKIPCPDHSVDVVVSFETFEHMGQNDQMLFLAEIKRVLVSNGLLIISTVDKKFHTDLRSHKSKYHIHELYYDEFTAMVRQNFSHCKFCRQQSYTSSLLLSSKSRDWDVFVTEKNPSLDDIQIETGTPDNFCFVIAFASEGELPDVNSSINLDKNTDCLQREWDMQELANQRLDIIHQLQTSNEEFLQFQKLASERLDIVHQLQKDMSFFQNLGEERLDIILKLQKDMSFFQNLGEERLDTIQKLQKDMSFFQNLGEERLDIIHQLQASNEEFSQFQKLASERLDIIQKLQKDMSFFKNLGEERLDIIHKLQKDVVFYQDTIKEMNQHIAREITCSEEKNRVIDKQKNCLDADEFRKSSQDMFEKLKSINTSLQQVASIENDKAQKFELELKRSQSRIHEQDELLNKQEETIHHLFNLAEDRLKTINVLDTFRLTNEQLKNNVNNLQTQLALTQEFLQKIFDSRSWGIVKILHFLRNVFRFDLWMHVKLFFSGNFKLLRDICQLERSSFFDPVYYLAKYPSIKEAGMDPYYHYCRYGWMDNLEPSEFFSCEAYRNLYPDVKNVNPLVHFLRYGKKEKRAFVNPLMVSSFPTAEGLASGLPAVAVPAVSSATKHDKVQDLFKKEFRLLQPIQYFISPGTNCRPKLNFITDALGNSLLGGVGTALLLASRYACAKGWPLRIVTRNENAALTEYVNFMNLMQEQMPAEVELYSDCSRNIYGKTDFKLEISKQDEFFTTSWWSTQAVKNMHLSNKIFYIIQEVEPYFYAYGDNHLFCSSLMSDTGICYIVNSHYLWDYFSKKYPAIVEHGIYFEPAFPRFLYHENKHHEKSKHKLFFYARKNHDRNLYWTGLRILDEALVRGMFPENEWDIYFAGSEIGNEVEFSNGRHPQFLGLLPWNKYAEFLSTVDLTFSLMYTPHPSYPPLDTIASGGVAVTNCFANKQSNPWCRNLIFSEMSMDKMLQALKAGTELALNHKQRELNFQSSTLPDSWKDSLKSVVTFMENYRNA